MKPKLENQIQENMGETIGWRTVWYSLKDWTATDTGRVHTADSIFMGKNLYASKQKAVDAAMVWLREYGDRKAAEYLDSVEVTE